MRDIEFTDEFGEWWGKLSEDELIENWDLGRNDKEIKKISPLD